MTCVVFPQELEHEGAPYADGRKVFLRTELIYEEFNLEHDPRIAEVFAKACYLTGESVLAPEIEEHVHQLYDRAAAAHWHGADSPAGVEPIVAKSYRGVDFVTNGYDYFFSASQISLKECAALATLDALNCQIDGRAFRKLCESKVVATGESAASFAEAHLGSAAAPDSRGQSGHGKDPVFESLENEVLFPEPEAGNAEICCSFHHFESFHPRRDPETIDVYTMAQDYAKRRIEAAPINVLGQEVFINPERFVIEGDRVHVLTGEKLDRVNFAACGNDEYSAIGVIGVDANVSALHLLVPPILFKRRGDLVHLIFDFFRNSWTLRSQPVAAPVPVIGNDWFGSANGWADAVQGDDDSEDDEAWPGYDDANILDEFL